MISLNYLYFLYASTIFLFFNSSSPLLFWFIMEVNLLLFLNLVGESGYGKKFFREEINFFYYLIQVYGSFFFLFSLYFRPDYYVFSTVLFYISVFLKMGLFPFYAWIVVISSSSSTIMFSFVLSVQKIPMYLIMSEMKFIMVIFFLSFSFIAGSVLIFFSKKLEHLLTFSSLSSSLWVFLICSLSDEFFYFYFFAFYTSSLFALTNAKKFSQNKLVLAIFFMIVGGLPPFSLFFFKFFLVLTFKANLPKILISFLWFFSLLSLLGYLKFLYAMMIGRRKPTLMKQKFCIQILLFFAYLMLSPFIHSM